MYNCLKYLEKSYVLYKIRPVLFRFISMTVVNYKVL